MHDFFIGVAIVVVAFFARKFIAQVLNEIKKFLRGQYHRLQSSKFTRVLHILREQTAGTTKEIPNFVAHEEENADQGCFSHRIDIKETQRIKSINFTLESDSKYWRAGLKVYSPNGNFQPLSDVVEGILFHIAYPSNRVGKMWVLTYISGKTLNRYIDLAKIYRVEMFINKNNFMTCLVNGEKCFQERINPINLENARLCAWADYEDKKPPESKLLTVRKFQVNFSDIRYTTSI